MAAYAHFGWDFDRIGPFNSTFTDSGGAANVIFSSGTVANVSLASAITEFTEWAAKIEANLNASFTLNGTYTVTYDQATNKLTVSCTESFSVSSLNTWGQRLLGSSGTSISSTTSYTSDNELWFSIVCALSRRARDKEEEEEPDVAADAVAGKESHFGIAYEDVAVHRDFTVAHEPVAQVFEKDVISTRPFSWQHAVKHARNLMPFAFVDDLETSYHYLRAEGAAWREPTRTPVAPGYRGRWDIRLLTRQMGT